MAAENPRPLETAQLDTKDWWSAGGLALGCLAIYSATACRTIYVGDSSELTAAGALFGIPHPPGYPTFTLLTGALMRLLPFERAFAANLTASVYASFAVGLLFLLARRLGSSRVGAAVGSLALAFGSTFWAQAVAIEVYGFDVVLLLAGLHLFLTAPRASKTVTIATGMAFGLWLGHRPLNVVYAPTLFAVLWSLGALDQRRLVAILASAAISALPFVFLPLRARAHPAIDIGDPDTLGRFLDVVRGAPYVRHWTEGTFDQGVGRLERHLLAMPRELGLAAVLGVVGLVSWLRGEHVGKKRLAAAFGWMVAANVAVCIAYHVLDIEVFFLPSTLALALFAAHGTDVVLDWLDEERRRQRWLVPLAVCSAVALLPANFAENDLRRHELARRLAEDIFEGAPANALLIVGGDTGIHALWYLQAVEHRRPDVIVFSPGHVVPWYVEQLKREHPGEPWPAWTGEMDQSAYTRAVRDAFIGRHPVVLTRSLPLEPYLLAGTTGKQFGAVPLGLLSEVLPFGTSLDVRTRADSTLHYFERVMARLLPRRTAVDPDTASIYLEYAVSMSQSAEMFSRGTRRDVADRLYRWVLDLRPDELDALVRADVKAGFGQDLPEARLEARAREGLDLLQRPPPPLAPSTSP